MPRIAFTSDSFVVFENQTSVDIRITRSGDLNGAGSFHLKTLQGTTDTALGKYLHDYALGSSCSFWGIQNLFQG